MSFNVKFSLTPLESHKHLYNSATSLWEYHARLHYYGVKLNPSESLSLEGSYNNNWVYLTCNNIGYPFPDPLPSDFYKRAVAYLNFKN